MGFWGFGAPSCAVFMSPIFAFDALQLFTLGLSLTSFRHMQDTNNLQFSFYLFDIHFEAY